MFRIGGSRNTFFTWPIWNCSIPVDVVRTLLALEELQQDQPDRRKLSAYGVIEVYRCQRFTVGKYRNFGPPVAV